MGSRFYTRVVPAGDEQRHAADMLKKWVGPGEEHTIHHSDPFEGRVVITLEVRS